MSDSQQHVAVIGAGISGLAAAWRVHEVVPNAKLTILESKRQAGGVLQTLHQDGFLIERSADSFITDPPYCLDLCRRLGLEDELIGTRPTDRRAFVVCRGKLQPVPEAFQIMAPTKIWSVLTSPVLSVRGKLRLFCERFVRTRDAHNNAEESLEQFATRRLGREAYERLVQPLVSGIYTADPKKLSVAATLPRFLEMEREHGSLSRGAVHRARVRRKAGQQESGARYGMFVTPRRGIGSIAAAILQKLPEDTARFSTAVDSIQKSSGDGWTLKISGGSESISCDKLIIAVPAGSAGRLLKNVDETIARDLRAIPYAGCAVVSLGYHRSQCKRSLAGFGFVAPAIEERSILSASFSSAKFPSRAPDEHELIRVFIGGACQPELLDLDDSHLVTIAREELGELAHVSGEPAIVHVARWENAMPQYHIGHEELVSRIEHRCHQIGNLTIVGHAFRGVGLPHCIRYAESRVDELLGDAG
jgi:oxygen-dependent protoporphyrinogen oxidase